MIEATKSLIRDRHCPCFDHIECFTEQFFEVSIVEGFFSHLIHFNFRWNEAIQFRICFSLQSNFFPKE